MAQGNHAQTTLTPSLTPKHGGRMAGALASRPGSRRMAPAVFQAKGEVHVLKTGPLQSRFLGSVLPAHGAVQRPLDDPIPLRR